jgi:penicillin amidase
VVIPAAPPAWWGKPKAADAPAPAKVAAAEFLNTVGSNNWAVSGTRSDTGAAIVADDMHLGISLPAIWYRAALQFPDGKGGQRRMVGVTLPGAPLIVVGSNGNVAGLHQQLWRLHGLHRARYRCGQAGPGAHAGRLGKPVVHEETILVKGAPAAKLAVRETSLGPIREALGAATRCTGPRIWRAQSTSTCQTGWADSLDQALEIAPTLGIPAQNFVGGDDKGTSAGPSPVRCRAVLPAAWRRLIRCRRQCGGGVARLAVAGRISESGESRFGQLATANSRQLAQRGL